MSKRSGRKIFSGKKITTAVRKRKYLINWSLTLGREELSMISKEPVALDKALSYIKSIKKEGRIEIYRFVTMEELTRRMKPPAEARISGIAIAEADSVEDVGEMLKDWVKGLSYGGVGTRMGIENYLEYEIKPLEEIAVKRG